MNITDYCKKCNNLTKPASKDPCKSCMDFGIRALGRPVNFRAREDQEPERKNEKEEGQFEFIEKNRNLRAELESRIKSLERNRNLRAELDQAVELIRRICAETGECWGCAYKDGNNCIHPTYSGICDNDKNNAWEWCGLIKEEIG